MSILRTKCPTLSDLAEAIGPIDGIDSRMAPKPLCDNIFDVQRTELVEVLERLRTAFWSDEITLPPQPPAIPANIPPPTILQTPQPLPQTPQQKSLKRTHSEPDDDSGYQRNIEFGSDTESKSIAKKRVRLNTPQAEETVTKLLNALPSPSSPSSLSLFTSLWPLKKSIIRQIKTDNRYNEQQLLSVLIDIYQTKSADQIRHLAQYFIPVAQAMRRENIVKMLEKWCM